MLKILTKIRTNSSKSYLSSGYSRVDLNVLAILLIKNPKPFIKYRNFIKSNITNLVCLSIGTNHKNATFKVLKESIYED